MQPVLAAPDDVDQAITRIFGPLRAPNFEELGPAPTDTPRVGDLLVANGIVSNEQIEAAMREQHRTGSRIGDVLLHAGIIGEDDLVAALAEQLEMPVLDIEDGQVDADVVRLIPEPLSRELRVAAVAEDELTLYVAAADALDAGGDGAHRALHRQGGRGVPRARRASSTRSSRRPTAPSTCACRSTTCASGGPRTARSRSSRARRRASSS